MFMCTCNVLQRRGRWRDGITFGLVLLCSEVLILAGVSSLCYGLGLHECVAIPCASLQAEMRCGNCQEVVFWAVFSSSARSNQISLAIEHIIEMYKLELLSVCILLFSFFVFCFVVCLDG